MSKKLFLALVPFLVFGMSACQRGNGGTSSGGTSGKDSGTSSQSSQASDESLESSEEDSSEESEQSIPAPSGEESAHKFALEGTEYKLYVDDSYDPITDIWAGAQARFISGQFNVTAGDSITVVANPEGGEPVYVYANAYNAGNNVVGTDPEDYTVKTTAEGVTLELYQYENGWAFNLGGGEAGGDPTAPTSGFALKITSGTDVSYMPGTDKGFDGNGKHVYEIAGVELAADDTFCMYDGGNGVAFNCASASDVYTGNGAADADFSFSADAITVVNAGVYTIEIQLQYENNSYYIHK